MKGQTMRNCKTCKNSGRPSYIDPCASCGGDPENRTQYDPSPSLLGRAFGEKMAEAFEAGLNDTTWNDAIEATDAARPNDISYLRKAGWMAALDRSLGPIGAQMDTTQRKDLFTTYCIMRIALEQDDLEAYNRCAAAFNSSLRRYINELGNS